MNDKSKSAPADVFIATLDMPRALIELAKRLEYTLVTNRENRSERERYVFILTAVATFLKDIEAPIEFADAYVNLARMLEDLDAGTVHPVLRANPIKNGSPKDNTFVWEGRANIALGMVAVLAAGKGREAAAKYVAKELGPALDRVRRSNSRQGEPWRAVANWHDDFSTKTVKDESAKKVYNVLADSVRDLVLAKPETERLTAATELLRQTRTKLLSD